MRDEDTTNAVARRCWRWGACSHCLSRPQAQPFQGLYVGAGAGYNLPVGIGATATVPPLSSSSNLNTRRLRRPGQCRLRARQRHALRDRGQLSPRQHQRHLGLGLSVRHRVRCRPTPPWPTRCSTWMSACRGCIPYIGGGVGYAWTNLMALRSARLRRRQFAGIGEQHQGRLCLPGDRWAVVPDTQRPGPVSHHRIPLLRRARQRDFLRLAARQRRSSCKRAIQPQLPARRALRLQCRGAGAGCRRQPRPAPAPARSYLVFFDWDKATLTDRARQIIKEAADNSTHVAVHSDRGERLYRHVRHAAV